MSLVEQAQRLISTMSRDDKVQLLNMIKRDVSGSDFGIESTPDVLGGEPRIVRTRIPVWLLERARRLGATQEQLLESFPSLNADDLQNAWAYVANHRDEVEQQIVANEES